jgi:predicted nuclease with RNAse H fold
MNVKQKGNRFEQAVARKLRQLFPNVRTARECNKWLDAQGVDFVETYPFQIQAKHVERGLDPHAVLERMPEVDGMYNVLVWKRNRKQTLVVLTIEDAEEIAWMLKRERIL